MTRSQLAYDAMQESVNARQRANLDLWSPVSVFDVTQQLGVKVRFVAYPSMEGLYQRAPKPCIIVSSLRPLGRRAFTCAHELGHHVYGHGATVDELRNEGDAAKTDEEFLADTFAGFLLMPTLGLRRAFASRGWKLETASPHQLYVIACEFGVGYATLIKHLAFGIQELSWSRASTLLKATPQTIRAQIVGEISPKPLVCIDKHLSASTVDVEVNSELLLPASFVSEGTCIERIKEVGGQILYRAVKPGIGRIVDREGRAAAFVRVAREAYVGWAKYRHLEDEGDE
jgi:Zn-dependent peptidase ImmA (M78 family)